nr:zinc finger protein 184-like [Rhipicephalus microplus]
MDVSSDPPVAGGDYVVSPNATVLSSFNVTFPHTIITMKDNVARLPIVNFGICAEVLPRGICLATLASASDYNLSAFIEDTPSPPSLELGTTQDGITKMITSDLPAEHVHALHSLLASYEDIIDLHDRPLGQMTIVKHRISTDHANPAYRRPYRISSIERHVIQKEVDKMLARNIIEPSSSPWASAVVLVKKKDNSWRFCVDYQNLNKCHLRSQAIVSKARNDAPRQTKEIHEDNGFMSTAIEREPSDIGDEQSREVGVEGPAKACGDPGHINTKTELPSSSSDQCEATATGTTLQMTGGREDNECISKGSVGFTTKQELLKHVHSHPTSTTRLECGQCGATFIKEASLIEHHKMHVPSATGDHKCPYCTDTFALQCDLTAHLRNHKAERPFACDLCGKRFVQHFQLVTHSRKCTEQ